MVPWLLLQRFFVLSYVKSTFRFFALTTASSTFWKFTSVTCNGHVTKPFHRLAFLAQRTFLSLGHRRASCAYLSLSIRSKCAACLAALGARSCSSVGCLCRPRPRHGRICIVCFVCTARRCSGPCLLLQFWFKLLARGWTQNSNCQC